MQASCGLQSLLLTHSGLQPVYGSPWYSWIQLHIPLVHSALVPHGNGMHGSWGSNTGTKYIFIITLYNYVQYKDELWKWNILSGGFWLQIVNGSPV